MDGARVVGLKMEHEGKEETLHGKVVLTAGGRSSCFGQRTSSFTCMRDGQQPLNRGIGQIMGHVIIYIYIYAYYA